MKKTKKRLTFGAFVIGTAIAATLTACHNTERGAETLYGPPRTKHMTLPAKYRMSSTGRLQRRKKGL